MSQASYDSVTIGVFLLLKASVRDSRLGLNLSKAVRVQTEKYPTCRIIFVGGQFSACSPAQH